MEFLDLLESVPAPQASADRLTTNPGETRARGAGARNPTALSEAKRLIERVVRGDRYAAVTFQEAMSTSDFPLLFGDILDRMLLGTFTEWTPAILQIARRRVVNDFRQVADFSMDGLEGTLDSVEQGAPYPEASMSENRDLWSVGKFGRRTGMFWEVLINADLDQFRDIPNRLAKAARRTQAKQLTQQYVDSTGPHASLYTGGNNNIVTSNPVLSVAALQTALTVLAAQTDADGEPIWFDSVFLVVPPALSVTADNILNAIQLELVEVGGTSNQKLIAQNWMQGKVTKIVDPYIPIVASSANGNTSWFLFGNPNDGRPALSYGVLRGHEEPELWVRKPDAQRVGGGDVAPEEGSFDTDSIDYRVRFVCGATRHTSTGGAQGTVGSEGDGS